MGADIDIYPVTIRGPLSTNRSGVSTFARIFTHEGRLYIAESRNKGRTVAAIDAYEIPEGEPIKRANKAGRWGVWSWSGCGCTNSWRQHKQADLAAMVVEPEPEPEPTVIEPDAVIVPPVTGSNEYNWPEGTTLTED